MPERSIVFTNLRDHGDGRGSAFTGIEWEPFLGTIRDLHIVTMVPGSIRGNHYHHRNEVLIVLYHDRWRLHWENRLENRIEQRTVTGAGAASVMIPAEVSHAIVNDGSSVLSIMSLSDGKFDPTSPDTFMRQVTLA